MSSQLEQLPLMEYMQKDQDDISNFVLEPQKGTKRMKEKFYAKASVERNELVKRRITFYEDVSSILLDEVRSRFQGLLPSDCTDSYDKMKEDVSNLLSYVLLESNSSHSFKLGLDYILASINDLTSLEEMNEKIHLFVHRFADFGIVLTPTDFQYTMFTEMYMKSFFQNSHYDAVKETFEQIYFKCPDIKLQLKMNLQYLIRKYDSTLSDVVVSTKNKWMMEYSIPKDEDAVTYYVRKRLELGERIASDEFYNTKVFLDGKKNIKDYLEGSSLRVKNYNTFALDGDYDSYSDDEKKKYNDAMMELYLTLNELKKYYHYDFILADLLKFYKEKDHAKVDYMNQLKEVSKEEKNRLSLYKKYKSSLKDGLFSKASPAKQKYLMIQMNDEIHKLRDLYQKLDDLEIRYRVSLLPDSSSIYDLFLVSLRSFPFLEKSFSSDEFEGKSLEENMREYLRFIYNPNNQFLRKVNGISDLNVCEIVSQKYRLLNLNLPTEMIDRDSIDATLQDISFINFIQNVEGSKINFKTIDLLCDLQEILKDHEQ